MVVSTSGLFGVDGIGDSEMVSGEMRQRIRIRLPEIRLTVGGNLGKSRTRVFENKILRKIFGAKRDGEWRKLHNVELHTLYSSPDIIRNIKFRGLKWAEHLACMGESRTGYRVLVGWPERKDVWRGRDITHSRMYCVASTTIGSRSFAKLPAVPPASRHATPSLALDARATSPTRPGKTPEKPQPGNLLRPGFEPGPPGFAARRADRYSTGVDFVDFNFDGQHGHRAFPLYCGMLPYATDDNKYPAYDLPARNTVRKRL
ncbi:hypothetical protein ANN_26756 [Periplaneta americana]|uniref:Uncharacterized protein n=1 Tax=Periplaneta americana TaxID=6978 RepID=A0ABQ8RYX9_PERAM|nr:hypothetical protein ANN_26756 [Periplaneta americana]